MHVLIVEFKSYDFISISHIINFRHLNNWYSTSFLCMNICYKMFNIKFNAFTTFQILSRYLWKFTLSQIGWHKNFTILWLSVNNKHTQYHLIYDRCVDPHDRCIDSQIQPLIFWKYERFIPSNYELHLETNNAKK